MISHTIIAKKTACGLRQLNHTDFPSVLIGFDGFVDSIISVVNKRYDVDNFDQVRTISELAQKIAGAAGKSSNYELVVNQQKADVVQLWPML